MISLTMRTWRWFRQPVSGTSHLMGAVIAVYGLAWLLPRADTHLKFWAAIVFGATMILLFLASAAYHLLPLSDTGVAFLRKIDHSSIFLFIAGCYTPVCLILLPDRHGPELLAIVWALAIAGVALKLFTAPKSRWTRSAMYLGLGWLSVVVMPDLWHRLPPSGVAGLLLGGAAYCLGTVVYASKWPDPYPEVFGFHEIWHLFVLAGAFSHFWMIQALF